MSPSRWIGKRRRMEIVTSFKMLGQPLRDKRLHLGSRVAMAGKVERLVPKPLDRGWAEAVLNSGFEPSRITWMERMHEVVVSRGAEGLCLGLSASFAVSAVEQVE